MACSRPATRFNRKYIRDGLHECAFFGADGLELGFVGKDVLGVKVDVVAREDDGDTCQPGLKSIETNGGFASIGDRAARFLSILPVGCEFGIGQNLFGHELLLKKEI